MTEQLKPCPFCGGSKLSGVRPPGDFIECQTCGCSGPDNLTISSHEDAIAAWNRRYPLPQVTQVKRSSRGGRND